MCDQTHGSASYILVLGETNLSKASGGFAYSVETAFVKRKDGTMVKTAKIIWHDELQGSGDELLALAENGEMAGNGKGGQLDAAVNFLLELLRNGPVLVSDIRKQAKAAGIKTRALQQAKDFLSATHNKRQGAGQFSRFEWSLPANDE